MNQAATRALFLVLGCVCFRIFFGLHPEWLPNISPLIAVAFVGAMYLPRAWGWLVGPVAFLLSDLAFLTTNVHAGSAMFSWLSLVSLLFFVLTGLFGVALAGKQSLLKIAAGSVFCSLLFYVLANTFSWWDMSATAMQPSYTRTLAGLWQANTVGLPGWQPTWTFLRNGMLGDLFFCGVLVAIFDRELLLHPSRKQVAVAHTA